jgi:hypothetical protein
LAIWKTSSEDSISETGVKDKEVGIGVGGEMRRGEELVSRVGEEEIEEEIENDDDDDDDDDDEDGEV